MLRKHAPHRLWYRYVRRLSAIPDSRRRKQSSVGGVAFSSSRVVALSVPCGVRRHRHLPPRSSSFVLPCIVVHFFDEQLEMAQADVCSLFAVVHRVHFYSPQHGGVFGS